MTTNSAVISFIKESDLIKIAGSSKKLLLGEEPLKNISYPEFDSKPVGKFELNRDFLSALEKRGFTFGPGTNSPYNEMVYLVGHSNQKGAYVFESDSWAWERGETSPQLAVYFRLSVSEAKRGVVCKPHIWGNCSGGACHEPTMNKFVRVVAEHFPDAHPLIKEFANIDSLPIIPWRDIGMGDVKSVGKLFCELYEKNEKTMELARSSLSPFDPNPNPKKILETKDRLFVLETDQLILFKQWGEQLQAFKASLS